MAIKFLATATPVRRAPTRQRAAAPATTDFRHLTQVMDELTRIQDDLAATDQLLRKAAKEVKANSLFKVDEADIKNSPEADAAAKPTCSEEELTNLTKHYGVTQRLYGVLNQLNALEATLKSSFPEDSKDTTKALSEFAKTRKMVAKQLDQAFTFLRDLAKEKAPPSFDKFTAAISRVASRTLSYESAEQYIYLFTTEKRQLAFANYLLLHNLTDEEGQMFPTMYIVSTMVIGDKAADKNQMYLTTMRDFAPPSDDLMARRVTDIKAAVTSLAFLLDLEHVSNTISHLPVPLLIDPKKINRNLFGYNSFIDTVGVDEDTGALTFSLKPTVAYNDTVNINKIATQLDKDVAGMSRKTRSTQTIRIKRAKGTPVSITFFLRRPKDAPAARADDLEVLSDRFNLDQDAISSILRVINK